MLSRIPSILLRMVLLLAIGVSVALFIDYLRPLPAFCEIGSGCDRVRGSAYAHVLGIPLPIFGIAGFGGMMVLTWPEQPWSAQPWARRLVRLLAIAGGVGGVVLLLIQALMLHVFCRLCLTVDISAIVAGVCALLGAPSESAGAPSREADPAAIALPGVPDTGPERWLWPSATVLALLAPMGWAVFQPSPPVPPEIASLWVPDKINVVEFADFECPFCRKLHPAMAQLLDEYADRVHFVRLNMPLAQHTDARTAARAYCCAEDQGQGRAMADALFSADNLSAQSCEHIAASVGLSLTAYRSCIQNAATDARIDEQMRRVRAAGLAGLPTVWIGGEVLVGLQSVDALSAAFAKAAGSTAGTRVPTTLLWIAFGIGLAAVAALSLRRPPNSATLP